MQDLPRKPPFLPDNPNYGQWMDGYSDHQATLAKGFKAPERKPEDYVPVDTASGEPLSRSEFVQRLTELGKS